MIEWLKLTTHLIFWRVTACTTGKIEVHEICGISPRFKWTLRVTPM